MMESDTVIYPPGETVWVKISNCPWWPAEVINESGCPIESECRGKKPLAVTKFLNEDYYCCISTPKNIQPFLVPNYKELKLKAEKDKRDSIRSKIGPAFRIALQRVGLPSEDGNAADSKVCETVDQITNQGQEQNANQDKTSEEAVELGRGSRKRKQVEKFIPRLPDSIVKQNPRGKKRRTLSTGSLSSSRPKSRNSSFSDLTNSPSIPYPSQSQTTVEENGKSSVVSRLELQNSLGAAVKRSLEAEYSSTASLSSSNEDSFPAESVAIQFPSSSPGNILLNRGLQCRRPHGQLLSARFTNLANQGRSRSGDHSEDSVALDNHSEKCSESKQQTGDVLSRCSSSVSSYDSNLDSEASESDEELPEGLSPTVGDSTGVPAVRDVVWVKYRHFNFWPAVVRRIQNHKGKRGPKKIQIQFLGDTSHFKENFYVSYRKDIVLPLDTARRKEFEDKGRQCEDKGMRKRFISSLLEVESYLNKKALGLLPPDKEEGFFDEDYDSDISDPRPMEETSQSSLDAQRAEDRNPLSAPSSKKERKSANISCEKMKEKRKLKNQVLLEYLLSDEMKNYLLDIFNGQRRSDRHTQYHSSVRERDRLRHSGFGQIADEEQQDKITYTFVEWYKENASQTADVDYILDVWVPEAIVYSMIKRRGYGRSRAWELFNKGCRLYKAEQRQLHQHLIRTARNISPADARRYNERLQERMEILS